MCEKTCCATCCSVWSIVGAIILIFLGIVVQVQPEYIITLDKDIRKDSGTAAGHLYGAAAMYIFLAFYSITSLYRTKLAANCADEARPLLAASEFEPSKIQSTASGMEEDISMSLVRRNKDKLPPSAYDSLWCHQSIRIVLFATVIEAWATCWAVHVQTCHMPPADASQSLFSQQGGELSIFALLPHEVGDHVETIIGSVGFWQVNCCGYL